MEELVKYLKAMLMLQVRSLVDSEAPVKLEVVLTRAGFTHKEIAELTGKSQAAVAKTISRSKLAPSGGDDERQDDG